MSKSLNFNNLKKHYLSVVLADDKNTTLLIGMPTKRVMDDLIHLNEGLEEFRENETDIAVIDDLYATCAKIMSRNKGGIKITPEYLGEIFDVEDIITFITAYTDFVSEIADSKN